MIKTFKILLLTLITTSLLSCSEGESASEKSGIVCTTGMVGDAVQNIVGTNMEVETLMGPGVDPHLYKVVHSDINLLQSADLVCYNGLHLEGKMTDVLDNLESQYEVPGIAFGTYLQEDQLRVTTGNAHDPHIWFDVNLWRNAVEASGKDLISKFPEMSEQLTTNLEGYLKELDQLHIWVKEQIASIPKEQRVLITAHDAFGYFGRAYDIEVRGLQGISTVAQAGIKERKELVDLIIDRKIKAIFVETSISDKQLKAIVEDCSNRGHTVKIGGKLYSDAMGAEGSGAETYIGMVRANVETIVSALR